MKKSKFVWMGEMEWNESKKCFIKKLEDTSEEGKIKEKKLAESRRKAMKEYYESTLEEYDNAFYDTEWLDY